MADYEDAELDINLQEPDDIGARIVLLLALSIWPEVAETDERNTWQRWLEAQGVMPMATDIEEAVLAARSLSDDALDICERAGDSLPALAWAVALVDEIPLVEPESDRAEMIERIPVPNEGIEPFLDQLVLRDEDEIALERERAEIWNWRLVSEEIRRQSKGANRDEVEEAIREVVLESAISFAIAEIDTEDFLVDGVPVRALAHDLLGALIVTSEERLRAFNWLCGLTEWDVVHLPD
ncbi:MAG TPA: DUF4272 domain-containing protein [Thermomicrobiales bacterium]|jgi:hypothetical protein|nr:DUF4272 domain-containing protein [Thermomicrobiales bacterium]